MQPMPAGDRLAADVRALLAYVGTKGLVLTGTRRLRLADVREINARSVEPEELDERIGGRTVRLRTEDDAWRVSLLRLVCEAAGLVKTRHGRLLLTAPGQRFAAALPPDALALLFRAWWWRGEWGLVGRGWIDLILALDRSATARELRSLGPGEHRLEAVGDHLRDRLRPLTVPPLPDHLLEGSTWGYAAWHSCLRILSAFGGCEARREAPGDRYSSLSSFTVFAEGIALLDDALAHQAEPPARSRSVRRETPARPRLRRAVGGAITDVDDDLATLEREERVRSWHPIYAASLDRGVEMVQGVNARLHLLLHQTVEEQLDAGDPPITRATYERLTAGDRDPHEVRHMLVRAVAEEIEAIGRDRTPYDAARFARRLAELPGSWDAAATDERRPPRLGRRDLVRLRRLPRQGGIWEGGVRELPVRVVGQAGPTHGAAWVETGTGLVRAMVADIEVTPAALLLRSFVRAALRPERTGGRGPALPVRVRVSAADGSAIGSALAPLAIPIEAAAALPAVDMVFASFAMFIEESGFPDDDPTGAGD